MPDLIEILAGSVLGFAPVWATAQIVRAFARRGRHQRRRGWRLIEI